MPASQIAAAFDRSLRGRRLLAHPYYQRWQEGRLTADELAEYAQQYRHFERILPEVLSTVAASLPRGPSRRLVESNLADESGHPRCHVELFEQFATAVGADDHVPPTEATRGLVDLYWAAAQEGPIPALAVIGAYETQAGEIAATKAAALDEHHRLGASGTEFWTVHAAMEETHAAWTMAALIHLEAVPATARRWAVRSANRWWSFLDERDAVRAA